MIHHTPSAEALAPAKPWSVHRVPCVGKHSVTLEGYDGDGDPVYYWTYPLDEDLEHWERVMQRALEMRRAKAVLASSNLPPLRLLNDD